jgi:hypothetical protein
MSADIKKLIDQLQNEDTEIIKIANNQINNLDMSVLEKEELLELKQALLPIMDNDNLTARFFAKKNLKRINEILSPGENPALSKQAEDAFGKTSQKSDLSMAMENKNDKSPEDPAEKPVVTASQAPVELPVELPVEVPPAKVNVEALSHSGLTTDKSKDLNTAESPEIKNKKTDSNTVLSKKIKKETKKKNSFTKEGSWLAGMAAVINIIIYLGITFDFMHSNLAGKEILKVASSDLMIQIVFSLSIIFGLSNLFLRKSMNIYSSGRLALIFTICIICFSYYYPVYNPSKSFNSFTVFNLNTSMLMIWAIILSYFYSVASIWERKNKFIKIKSIFTLIALYPLAGLIISAIEKPLFPFFYTNPYTLDNINFFNMLPYYLKPVFLGFNIIIPLIQIYIFLAFTANLFTLKLKKSLALLLIFLINLSLLIFAFNGYSNAPEKNYAFNNGLAQVWQSLYTSSKYEKLKPPSWLISSLKTPGSENNINSDNTMDSNDQSRPENISPKSENNSGSSINDTSGSIDETTGVIDTDYINDTIDISDTSIIEKNALASMTFQSEENFYSHLNKIINTWLKANDNMVSKESFNTFKSRILAEATGPADKLNALLKKNDKNFINKIMAQAELIFSNKFNKLFPEKNKTTEIQKAELHKNECFLNIQKISAAIESYNFSKDSPEKFMKKIDFNLLYPAYLPSGIPECPEKGKYEIISEEGRNILKCTVHGSPLSED